MAPKKKVQYYTVQFEKFLEIVSDTEKTNLMITDHIKDLADNVPVKEWDTSPVYDFLESCLLVNSFRDFLDNKINNPSEEEVEFVTKNNIKDVLFSKDELEILQSFFLAIESKKEYLIRAHNFSCSLN
jgi:hypothetical protein